jgi:hypothetical protein
MLRHILATLKKRPIFDISVRSVHFVAIPESFSNGV